MSVDTYINDWHILYDDNWTFMTKERKPTKNRWFGGPNFLVAIVPEKNTYSIPYFYRATIKVVGLTTHLAEGTGSTPLEAFRMARQELNEVKQAMGAIRVR